MWWQSSKWRAVTALLLRHATTTTAVAIATAATAVTFTAPAAAASATATIAFAAILVALPVITIPTVIAAGWAGGLGDALATCPSACPS